MIKKLSIIYFLILNIFVLDAHSSKLEQVQIPTVEIKLSVQKDGAVISFISKDKINFDIINEKKQLKVISYTPVKFTYTPEVSIDISPEINKILLKIADNAQGFELTGPAFNNVVANQIEKNLNGFSYSFKNEVIPEQAIDPVAIQKSFFVVNDQQWFFNFSNKTASAVFFRENFLWVVFSEYKKFEITPEVLALDNNIKNIIQIPSQDRTILRFELHKVKDITIRKDERSWVLDWRLVSTNSENNRQSINQYFSPQAKGIFFPINNYIKKVIDVLDPDMQDTLKIIMSQDENHGVDFERNFVDFKLVKTLQGVVINIFNDKSYVAVLENGIEIILPQDRVIKKDTNPEFLINDPPIYISQSDEKDSSNNDSLLKFQIGDDLKFRSNFLKILNSFKKNDNLANLELIAKFYFMNQLYVECAGILNNIYLQVKNQELLMLGVASNYYLGEFPAAEKILASLVQLNNGKNEGELNFWQNLIQFSLSQEAGPINFLSSENKFLKNYPNEIKSKIAIAEVEDYLEKNKSLDQLPALLESLENITFKRSNLAYVKYLKSMYLWKKKESKRAYALWDELIKSYDPKCQLLATLAFVENSLAEYKISQPEAIKKLLQARFVWRGGVEEYKLLKLIKELYIQMGDKVSALSIIKLMLAYDLPNNDSFYLVAEISKLLTDVFLHYQDLKDIKVISLFYEFKEMIPIGALGDEIILSITKRMINLDMIDKATVILEHQMKFRQNDINKVLIGCDLAELYLMDNQPAKALNTLLEIKNVNVEANLQKKQKYLLAKAYFKLNKYQQVKKILENDFEQEASEILIDTYFKEQKWYALQILLELEVFQIPMGKDISEKSKNYIEKLLFCYYIQGQPNAIEDLRKMLDKNGLSEQYITFKLLTEFLQRDLVSVNSKSIKEYLSLDSLEAFLNSYKDYIKLPQS